MDAKLVARIRKILEAIDAEIPGGDPRDITLTQQLELLIAPGASPYGEIVRVGRAFLVNTTSAVAAVVAIPTTAVMFAMYNNEPDGGRTLIIDWVAASNVVSTAVVAQAQLLGLVGQVRETPPTDANLVIKKLNGLGTGSDTQVRTILTATALPATTGLATNWFPIGPSITKPSAIGTPGYGLWQALDGRIEVAPGRYFAMHVLANVVGETFQGFVAWHEKQLLLG